MAPRFFQSTIAAYLWLVVRVWVGYDFLIAGWHKFTTPAWVDGSGQGILGFWKGALGTTPSGAPVITFDWYRSFIQFLVNTNRAGWSWGVAFFDYDNDTNLDIYAANGWISNAPNTDL